MSQAASPTEREKRITIEPCGKRMRASFAGQTIAESDDALILREAGYPPRVYFPQEHVRMDLLRRTEHATRCPWKGEASYWTLRVGDETLENAAWAYLMPIESATALKGRLSFVDAVRVEA